MEIIAVRSKNYKVPGDTMIQAYFTNMNKAIQFAINYLKQKEAKNVTEVLSPDLDNYKSFSRIEYTSHYGYYPCALEFMPIHVEE